MQPQPGPFEIREMPGKADDPAARGQLVQAGLQFIEAHQQLIALIALIAQGRDVYVTRTMEEHHGN